MQATQELSVVLALETQRNARKQGRAAPWRGTASSGVPGMGLGARAAAFLSAGTLPSDGEGAALPSNSSWSRGETGRKESG